MNKFSDRAISRIVSLLPSATEIAFTLGLQDQLVGVTFECNFPPQAKVGRKIVVTGLDTHSLTPGQIDAMVRAKMAAGENLYELNDDALKVCNPDLIVSQDLCRVCAVPSGEVDAAVARLNCDAPVLQLDPQTLEQVIDSVGHFADAAGVSERGVTVMQGLRARLQRLEISIGDRPKPTVFVAEWVDPLFLAGHWVPDVVVAGGGTPVLAVPGGRSVACTWDEVDRINPDVIIVSPCGYSLAGAIEQADTVLKSLKGAAKVFAIDADSVMVRPGPRLVDGAEAIASVLHGIGDIPKNIIERVR
jgi:iron complex transport system substrate-binding protein